MTRSTAMKIGAVVVAVVAVGWTLIGGGGSDFERPIVLVSGRDDHGLLVRESVELLTEPEGQPVGEVADGSLVEVLEEESTWLRVRTFDTEPTDGWVDDFHLRGVVHLVGDPPACPVATYGDDAVSVYGQVPPSTQVELFDHHTDASGRAWVGVRPLGDQEIVLVPLSTVQELAGPRPEPGTPCEKIEPAPGARPHRH